MVALMRYMARVERDGRFWLVTVTGPDGFEQVTQARRLTEVEAMARDLVAIMNDVLPDSFGLDVAIILPPETEALLQEAREAQAQLAELQEHVGRLSRSAAHRLHDEGLSGAEVAKVLDVSPQRVSQLINA